MALSHVKQYLYTMQSQYLEMKQDLTDFQEAFKSGFITQEQLEAARQDVAHIENNYHRLLYIMHLFEIPAKSSKRAKFDKSNAAVIEALRQFKADDQYVISENDSVLDHLRAQLKRLSKKEDISE